MVSLPCILHQMILEIQIEIIPYRGMSLSRFGVKPSISVNYTTESEVGVV